MKSMKQEIKYMNKNNAGIKAGVPLLPTLFLCFMALLAVPFSALALSPHLVISEFIVDVSGPESDSEMIELYNPTGMVWDIGGWDIAYKSAAGSSWSAICRSRESCIDNALAPRARTPTSSVTSSALL